MYDTYKTPIKDTGCDIGGSGVTSSIFAITGSDQKRPKYFAAALLFNVLSYSLWMNGSDRNLSQFFKTVFPSLEKIKLLSMLQLIY